MLHGLTCRRILMTISIMLAVTPPAHATAPSLGVVATWGGAFNTVEVVGSLAYTGHGRELLILDITDPAAITKVGALDLSSAVRGIAIQGNYAYVGTTNPYYFCVVNIANPAAPTLVWQSLFGGIIASTEQVEIRNNYAYVRNASNQQIDVYDIGATSSGSPTSPWYIGAGIIDVRDLMVVGDLAYVIGWSSPALRIYNLALNPLAPPLVGSVLLGAADFDTVALALYGTHAYVLVDDTLDGGVDYLAIVDVENPLSPQIVDSTSVTFPFPRTPTDVATDAAGRLYIAEGASSPRPFEWGVAKGMMVFDLTADPAAPALLSTRRTHGSIEQLWPIAGSRVLAGDLGEGLIVYDVANPAAPQRVGHYYSPGILRKMAKAGNLLYIVDRWNGFTILNVANPLAPTVTGVYQTPFSTAPDPDDPIGGGTITVNKGIENWGIAVRNDLAYLTAGFAGVHIVNVANPAAPVKVGEFGLEPGWYSVAIELDGNVAHIGAKHVTAGARYINLNIADTLAPIVLQQMGLLELGGGPLTIVTKQPEKVSYVAADGALLIVDTSNPSRPASLGAVTDPTSFPTVPSLDCALSGSTLFAADHSACTPGLGVFGGLAMFDVGTPFNRSPLGSVRGCPVTAVAVQNNRAYVTGFFPDLLTMYPHLPPPPIFTSGTHYCLVVDVADPLRPNVIAYAPAVGNTEGNHLLADEPYVYLALGDHEARLDNLRILKAVGLPETNPADLNHDGHVSGIDLAILLAAWGACPPKGACAADLNHDDVVSGLDLAMLLGVWG